MASTNPVVFQGTLAYPPDEGVEPVSVPFGGTGSYAEILDVRLALTGTGSTVVPFGSIDPPGVKFMLVEYEAMVGGSPVNLRINGGTDNLELTPGGFIAYCNPSPSAGLTAITLDRTGDATIRVRLFA